MALIEKLERYLTTRNMKRRMGNSAEKSFLELMAINVGSGPFGFPGDDFQGDTLNGLYQSTASGANSAAAAIFTGQVNGAIKLDAGDANAGRCDLSWGLHYMGGLNAIYVARFKINVLTTRKFEIGFTDVISGTDAGAVNVKATPTFRADDCVVLCYDTDANTVLSLMGTKATVAATPAAFATALVADTYYYFGVALENDGARGFLLDADAVLLEEQVISAAVTPTVLLTPWLFAQNRAGNAGFMTADWHWAYQRRTTGSV